MSVFEKHGTDIATYEKTGGVVNGRLLYAMAILSDCQELLGHDDDLFEELDEVKELLQSLIKENEFTNLWGCREIVRDGEAEYGCEFLVVAADMAEAEKEAWEYVKRNYSYDCEDNDEHPYTEFLNEDGWIEIGGDYRWTQAEVCRQINSIEELLQFIPVVNKKLTPAT